MKKLRNWNVTKQCCKSVNILDTVIDTVHRIGKTCTDNKTKKSCKSVIVHFTTFRHRTMVYRAEKNMKNNVRVKLDLTKSATTCSCQQANLSQIMIALNFVMQILIADQKLNGQMTN